MDKIPELLTIEEVCKVLRISKSGMYRIVETRAIPFYRIGRVLRFDGKDVLAYIEKSRVGSRDEWK